MDPKKPNDPLSYLSVWLERFQQAVDVAPHVQMMYETQEWKSRTLENRPTAARSISIDQIDEWDHALYMRLVTNLPMLPTIDRVLVMEASSTAVYSASTVVSYLEDVSKLQTPTAVQNVEGAVDEYRALQELHHRPEQIRSLLQQKLPTVAARFDSALHSYRGWRSGLVNERAAALDTRTFLEGVEGVLREKAGQHRGENMPRELILERLFSSAPTRFEVQDQFNERSRLIDTLSAIAKARNSLGFHKLDALWSRVLDHAFIVVGALN